MPDSPLPLTADEKAELARVAAHLRNTAVYANHEDAADGIDRLLADLAQRDADLARVEGERDEARAMFGEAHERQKRAESDCDTARAESARLRDRIAYLEAGLDAMVRTVDARSGCPPTCASWSDDHRANECNCGYVEAADDGCATFAAAVLAGEADLRGALAGGGS